MKKLIENWFKVPILLCVYGFVKEIRPSDPFLNEFFTGPLKNITEEEVNHELLPIDTYSHFASLIVVFLITDLCRYKPFIILHGLSGITICALLIWSGTFVELQAAQALHGIFLATEIAYFTYIYAKVEKEHFSHMTSQTRAVILGGKVASGLLSQLLISCNLLDYGQLHYISFSSLILATIWSVFLPSARHVAYFHKEEENKIPSCCSKVSNTFILMKKHFVTAFTNTTVLKWALFYSLATCGFLQVRLYIQPLWKTIKDDDNPYNGVVEALFMITGLLTTLIAGYVKIDWSLKIDLSITLAAILLGFLVIISSQSYNILLAYACYIVYGGLYYFMATTAVIEIVKRIEINSYGFVLGIISFVAHICQTVLTSVVVTKGASIELRYQHIIYGLYHLSIAIVYIGIGLTTWLKGKDTNYSRSF